MRGNRFTIEFPTFKATFGTKKITIENKRGVIARITTAGIDDPEPAYVYSYNALGYISKMINRYKTKKLFINFQMLKLTKDKPESYVKSTIDLFRLEIPSMCFITKEDNGSATIAIKRTDKNTEKNYVKYAGTHITAVNTKSGIQYKFKNHATLESDLRELRNIARKYAISL